MSTRGKAAVTDTLPDLFPHLFPGHDQDPGLDLPPLTPAVEAQIGELGRVLPPAAPARTR